MVRSFVLTAAWVVLAFVMSAVTAAQSASTAPLFDTVDFHSGYFYEESRLWWVDYNGDSVIDYAATGASTNWGQTGDISFIPGLYRNDGFNHFARDTALWFRINHGDPLNGGWADFDNDNRPDFLIAGTTNSPENAYTGTFLLRNLGDGMFASEIPRPWYALPRALVWGDFDNDGKVDVIVAPWDPLFQVTSIQLWKNMGGGSFSNVPTSLQALDEPGLAVGDFDNDGWLDLVIVGQVSTNWVTELWKNDQNGDFVRVNLALPGATGGSVDSDLPLILAADFDNDGWLDLLIGANVYYNDHHGSFSDPVTISGLGGVYAGAAGDFDNDGRLDLVLAGYWSPDYALSVVAFHNDLTNGFTPMADFGSVETDLAYADVSVVDFNHDGKLDISSSSYYDREYNVTYVYRNQNAATAPNNLPTAPTNLQATVVKNGVWFSWSPATDVETPSPGLTYNVRVGSAPGASDVVSALSNADGFRIVPGFGNAGHRTNLFIRLSGPQIGSMMERFYWSVQAVDSALAGGSFAEERVFTLAAVPESLHLERETNGTTLLFFVGSNEATYTVESSQDLVNWVERAKIPASGTEVYSYADDTTANVPFRFYRVRFP